MSGSPKLVPLMLAGVLLLSGCAGGAGTAPEAAGPPSSAASAADPAGAPVSGPSEAAKMPCSAGVRLDIGSILGLADTPQPEDHWAPPVYTCTYALPEGSFVLSVQEAADDGAARKEFDSLQSSTSGAAPIEGLANLGFPAFQSESGIVGFVKDNMTLKVDASALKEAVGPHQVTRSALAYQVATVILACWKS